MAHDDLDSFNERPSRRERDDEPTREPMRGGRTPQGEWGELQVLVRRFLQKRVGEPWADVYRELQHTSFGVTHGSHRLVMSRIHDLVADDVVELDGEFEGELGRRSAHTGEVTPLSAETRQHPLLYVCPATALLKRHVPDDARNKIRISGTEQVRRLGKRWYLLTLAPIPERATRRAPAVDVVLRVLVAGASPRLRERLRRVYGQAGVFACDKRQLGKSELARLKPAG